MSVIVVGVGQTMRGDDAIGVLAVQSWCSKYPQTVNHPKVQVEIAELPGLDLLELISGAEKALIVDAVEGEGGPGSILLMDEAEVSAFDNGSGSAHGWSVGETIQLGRNLKRGDLPDEIPHAAHVRPPAFLGQNAGADLDHQPPAIREQGPVFQ